MAQRFPTERTTFRVSTPLTLLFCFALLLGVNRFAWAKPDFVLVFTTKYAPKANGTLDKAAKACTLCHAGTPPKLNPYGTDIKAELKTAHTKTLTPEILQTVEAKDSDGDGATNGDEIKNDTDPAAAESKPAGTTGGAATTTHKDASNDNPFAPETFLKPKHANHPVIVHFPIALFIMGLFFDLLGTRMKSDGMVTAGYYNLSLASLTSLLSIGTGLLAWQMAYGGVALEGWLRWHLILGIVTSALIFALWRTRAPKHRSGDLTLSKGYFAIAILTMVLIALLGHIGGFLVYGG